MNAKLPANATRAIRRIRPQFPDTGEGRLMMKVLEMAIRDLGKKAKRKSAIHALSGKIYIAEICGVDSSWIHRVLKEEGFDGLGEEVQGVAA